METLGNGDGGNWPPDGDGLPGLPPSWGPVVVPDDPAELAEEAARVRAELRGATRRQRRRRRLRWFLPADPPGQPGNRLPAVVLMLAIVATLASLFTLSYTGAQRGAQQRAEETGGAPGPAADEVPAVDLIGPDGQAVALRAQLPAVILLTEGCACDELVAQTAAALPAGVSLLVVARRTPVLPGGVAVTGRARPLADPAGGLRDLLGVPPAAEQAAALLVTASARIALAVPRAESVDAFRADLARLGGR